MSKRLKYLPSKSASDKVLLQYLTIIELSDHLSLWWHIQHYLEFFLMSVLLVLLLASESLLCLAESGHELLQGGLLHGKFEFWEPQELSALVGLSINQNNMLYKEANNDRYFIPKCDLLKILLILTQK